MNKFTDSKLQEKISIWISDPELKAYLKDSLIFKFNNWYVWVSIVGVFALLGGYLYGIKVFNNNIWLVTLTSWTALVIAEIIIAKVVFKTAPEGNVLLGFVFVLIGFIVANL